MGLLRKIKRKRMLQSRKIFMKEFKKKMRHFKKQVKCSMCGSPPRPGEDIDQWRIEQESNNIDLICTECYTIGKEIEND